MSGGGDDRELILPYAPFLPLMSVLLSPQIGYSKSV